MNRWKHIIARGLLVLSMLTGLWVAKDAVLRWAIIQGAQAVTGAKVEIGHVKTYVSTGEIRLFDLQIANPRDPMMNLLQTDEAVIQLDPTNLVHRRFVIRDGTLHNLQLNTPRMVSGALDPIEQDSPALIRWFPQDLRDKLRDLGRRFLDTVEVRKTESTPTDLHMTQSRDEIQQTIAAKLAEIRESASTLSGQVSEISHQFNDNPGNPLRESQRLQELAGRLPQVGQGIQQKRDEIERLKSDFATQLVKLSQARDADLADSKRIICSANFDSSLLSSILIGPRHLDQVDESLQWIQWLRNSFPTLPNQFQPRPSCGVEVRYKTTPRSDVYIKSLSFDGSTVISGRNFNFFGTVHDWTSPPVASQQPISLEIRAQGGSHVYITAQMDRRDGKVVDNIHLVFPETSLEGQRLGDPKVMLVESAPGLLYVEADVTIDGQEVDGTLSLRQTQTAITVTTVHDLAGGPQMAEWLNSELADVDQFETKLRFSGTLDHISVESSCDLGDRIAEAAARAARREVRATAGQSQAIIDGQYQAAVKHLTDTLDQNCQALMEQLQSDLGSIERMEQIADIGIEDQSIRR